LVNLGILFYLRQQMIKDLACFKVSNNVQDAGQLGGCLIGLGMVILYLMLAFGIGIVFALLGVPIPE